MNKRKHSGLYEICCYPRGTIYIGSSVNIYRRWQQHKQALRANKHKNRKLQAYWNKYGEEAFTFCLLEIAEPDQLIEREQAYLDAARPSLNINEKAGNSLGVKRTPETRKRISDAVKADAEAIARCRRMAEEQRGKSVHDDATKKKIGEASRRMWERRRASGWKQSAEAKEKIKAARRRQVFSEESREKLSKTLRAANARKRAWLILLLASTQDFENPQLGLEPSTLTQKK
jgi:group I intron endonuclease